jgi:(p)ppGpp synthase/HD superfamily hydrolase
MPYSTRFEEALVYAARVHAAQTRKGTGTPYITHLLAVAALVGEHGGSEDQVIAALLHDAPEDQGGEPRLEDIRGRFGDAVADIVKGCSDTFENPKPPWRQRKEAYLEHLAGASDGVRLVSAADKLHNARSLVADLRQQGEAIFDRFNGKKDGTLWYYREVVRALEQGGGTPLVEELRRVVAEMHALAGSDALV